MQILSTWLKTPMIVIRILNLSGRGKGAAREKKYRPRSLLRVPKEKKGKAAEPDIDFKIFANCKFLIYSISTHF